MHTHRAVRSADVRDRRLSYFISGLAVVAAVGHGCILVFAAVARVPELVAFNIGSVALYIALFLLCKTGRYTVVLVTTLVEVLFHAVVATVLIGWEAYFHLYLLCLIPLIYYIDQWPLRVRGAASVVVLLVYVGLGIVVDQHDSTKYAVTESLNSIARYGNMAITAAVLIALSYFYQSAVSRAERYMEHYSDTLHKLSSSDPLTGVLNRRGTERELRRAYESSVMTGSPIAVAILDLDHFKAINDRYGHGDGDIVLQKLAVAVASVVRGTDSFGRWGGEEFLAVLPSTDATGVELATERIKGAIDELKVASSSGAAVTVSATIGVAVADPSVDGSTIDDLLRRADDALYRGKAAGRDCIVFAAAAPEADA